jgi:hypothetical protein
LTGQISETIACRACPSGYTCPRTGMTKAQECGQGSYQVLPGHALISCSLCETGKYNEKITNATSDTACESCPEGSTTLSTGAKSSTECITVTFRCKSKSGQYTGVDQNNGNVCVDCPAGYFGASGTTCTLCPRGYFNEQKKQHTCKQCGTNVCRNNLGSTTSTALTDATFKSIVPSSNDTNVKSTSSNSTNDQSTESGIPENTRNVLYGVLASIIAVVIMTHRLLPTSFRVLDIAFAGDHFIEGKKATTTTMFW